MGNPAEKRTEYYTYADYLTWDDGKRWELIQGIPYCLAAPSSEHQRLITRLLTQFGIFLEGKTCEVFTSPFDVILSAATQNDEEIDTVIQPDLLVCCNPAKITHRGCEGAPDLIMEILSPSSFKRDLNDKFQLYEAAGVREYWIVSPGEASIVVYLLDEKGHFQEDGIYYEYKADTVPVRILEGLTIDLKRIFS